MNIDAVSDKADVVADVRKLPYDDNSADCICAIHVIEHFYKWETQPMLEEWKRVLKVGGRLVLELPCMDKVFSYIADCVANERTVQMRYTWWAFWGDPGLQLPEMGHKWGYTVGTLRHLLEKSGFRETQLVNTRYHNPSRDMRLEAVK